MLSALGRTPWWRGARGEYYVAVQMVLLTLLLIGDPGRADWPAWTAPLGLALIYSGGLFSLGSLMRLGPSLSPLPKPRERGRMVEHGPYALVRHPVYSGLILAALGWALWRQGWMTLGYAALLAAFLDIKSRREERWLMERYPEYAAYRARVKRLIPWVY